MVMHCKSNNPKKIKNATKFIAMQNGILLIYFKKTKMKKIVIACLMILISQFSFSQDCGGGSCPGC